jgi:hypothetical protein
MIQPTGKAKVTPTELRRMFRDSGTLDRIKSRDLHQVLSGDAHPAPPTSGQPFCTRSQILSFFDVEGNKIAVLHQYKRTDGSIGGSGQPDPKMLLIGRTIYFV